MARTITKTPARDAVTLTVTLVVLAAFVVAPTNPAAAFHDGPGALLGSWELPAESSFAMKLRILRDDGPYSIDYIGHGPATAPHVAAGAFIYDEHKTFQNGGAFVFLSSPDRLMVNGPTGDVGPSDMAMSASDPASPGTSAYTLNDAESDGYCPFWCMGTVTWTDAGTYYIKGWMGGAGPMTIELRSDDAVLEGISFGTSYMLSDQDLDEGALNVQFQQGDIDGPSEPHDLTPAGPLHVGAKVMADAYKTIDSENGISGFWGRHDSTTVCQFDIGLCLFSDMFPSTSQFSYESPSDSGTATEDYFVLDDPPGEYRFQVDYKADPWVAPYYTPGWQQAVYVGEEFAYLAAADVAFP